MERERITGDQAFDILRRASQQLNIKIRDIAHTLIAALVHDLVPAGAAGAPGLA
ncbi:MAG TPA: ANTAR domain-containing protein [Acidimicrobiales bacterium]|nr:ANTAR domain-containing protein [Acidimicrobiales bacterium]